MLLRHQRTIGGTSVRLARTLDRQRMFQTCQYRSAFHPMRTTKAASRNELKSGPTITAKKTKTVHAFRLSNSSRSPIKWRTQMAPSSASKELLLNQARLINNGTPL